MWLLLGAELAVLAVSVAAVVPSVRARVKGVPLVMEALGGSVPRPFAPGVTRTEAALDGVTGYRFAPARPAPPVLLLPGAALLGKDDPRAIRLATSLARAGRLVFVPDLELSQRRFVEEDLDRIVRAALALEADPGARGRVAVLGISYGGSFALVAAADPRLRGRLEQVAVFGAYFDLIGVIQAVTTGISLVEGRSYPWRAAPVADEILERNAVELAGEGSAEALQAVLKGDAPPSDLDRHTRALYELLRNRDPARVVGLAEQLAPEARSLLARFSPSSVAEAIDTPIVAMHSTEDPAVPYGEAVRLTRALPDTRLVTVGGFRHVDFRAPGGWRAAAGDLLGVWRFATWLLEAQE